MPQHLVWLFGRAGIPLMAPADDNGGDLPGGNGDDAGGADDEGGADNDINKPGENQPATDGESDDETDNEGGEKPKPSDAEARLLRDAMKHKARAKELQDQLKAIQAALGDTKPDDIKQILTERKEAERLAMEKRGEYDRILEQVKSEHESQVSTLQQEIADLQAKLGEKDGKLEDLTVGQVFNDSSFIRESSLIPVSIARKEFGQFVEIVDGVPVVYDKPRGAQERTPLVDGSGKPKSFDEAIAFLYSKHPDAPSLLRSKAKPGAGSLTTDPGKKVPEVKEVSPGISRIAAGLAAQKGQ